MYEDCKVLGPYRSAVKGQERRFVIIHFPDGKKKTTAYARYLLEVRLGRELGSDEDADHIDGNWLNDDLDNLRALPSSINRSRDREIELAEFDCPNCGVTAAKPAHKVRHNRKQGKAGPFCSRRCAGQHQHRVRVRNWYDETVSKTVP